MSLLGKPLTQIDEADLNQLITDGEAEGKYLDYKRDTVGTSDGDKKEFLADISSFANSAGGHLVFGMDEQNGVASALIGLAVTDTDAEIARLENIIRTGIRPAIYGLETTSVLLTSGRPVIVVRIPKSWYPPHQVVFQGVFRFYGRASNSKYLLEADELRSIVLLSENGAEKIRNFRVERVAKIVANEASAVLEVDGKTVTHIVPLSAFTSIPQLDLSPLYHDPLHMIRIFGGESSAARYNVDGFIRSQRRNEPSSGYAQVFRNGCIEIVEGFSAEANSTRALPGQTFERRIAMQVQNGKQVLSMLGGQAPFVMMVTLLGMKGWHIRTRADVSGSNETFDRDPLFLPETVIQTFDQASDAELLAILDPVWHAAGWPGTPNINSTGQWIG